VPGDEMGFLACLFRCPQEDLVEEDGDEEEGEQYRINRQVASGDDAHGLLSCVLFFFLLLFPMQYFVSGIQESRCFCSYLPCYKRAVTI
jgi:hypothetical protein